MQDPFLAANMRAVRRAATVPPTRSETRRHYTRILDVEF